MKNILPSLRRAVTLLEALTVLVIIGIVVFVTLPHLTQSKSNADMAAAKAKAIQLNIAKDAYISMLGAEKAQINWRNAVDDNARFALIKPFINPPTTATKLVPASVSQSYDSSVFSTPSYIFTFYPYQGGEKIIAAPVIINGSSGDEDGGTFGGGIIGK